ncbi:MAG: electron transport complex subunit RsxC [Oscillospiraceae bacterium]|nr:electron transport complex subunit RsxC [Oscillospiraceae bacterium]
MSKLDGLLKAVGKVKGGVHADYNKNTAETATIRVPLPRKVVVPMLQHIGAPCVPTVKKGDTVKTGQLIGDSESYVSAPVHASVSGTVSSVGNVRITNGATVPAVIIESDGSNELYERFEPPKAADRDGLIAAVRASGLVGLGGAGFPAHVKLNFPKDKKVDTLVINAAECEPYITSDYRECIEHTGDIIDGASKLSEVLGFSKVIIACEDNKPRAMEVLTQKIRDEKKGSLIRVMTLASKYPMGAEKMIVQSALNKKIPPGKLPLDVGCIVMNVTSVAFTSRYLKTGKPLISRTVTVDGNAVAEPKNLRVPMGMTVSEIIDFCGLKQEPAKIIAGGPMMGTALVDGSVPILKKDNAILAFTEGGLPHKKEWDCIRCGKCTDACPLFLMPMHIDIRTRLKDAKGLEALGVMSCMECGSCAYACPAGKPLVQYMRLGKEFLKEEEKLEK